METYLVVKLDSGEVAASFDADKLPNYLNEALECAGVGCLTQAEYDRDFKSA